MKRKGIIAAGHTETVKAGVIALETGGNAFDAAVAAFFAACVAEPVLASPGGGGFLLAHTAEGSVLYDFFTQTPRRKKREGLDFYPVFADFGTTRQEFHIGAGACATPGALKGIFQLHSDRCRLPMKALVEPAVKLARQGVVMEGLMPYLFEVVREIYLSTPEAARVYGRRRNRGEILGEGDIHVQPELAEFLEAAVEEGADLFYRGEVGGTIAGLCAEKGGHLESADFENYEVKKRDPLRLKYRGIDILMNPPPSVGGVLIGLALKLLEKADLSARRFGSQPHLEVLARTMALTGGLKKKGVPCGTLEEFIPEEIFDPELYGKYERAIARHCVVKRGTTHISIIDGEGNIATMTLSNGEGSGLMVPGCGFMLNNMLGEEDVNPLGFHRWEPNTRIASMMSPSIIFMKDKTIATGSGGSNRIRSAILQVMLNCIDFEMTVEEAVCSPRIHYENGLLNWERGFPASVVKELKGIFPETREWENRNLFFGGAHSAFKLAAGGEGGVGDPRRSGVCGFAG